MDLQNGAGNVGGHRRRLLAAMETDGAGFSAGAAEHAWRPSPSPWPPSSPHVGEDGGT